jgi:GH25 family lysozyme M1 (1,4-beta-N-acetylmuramidase)
VPPYHQPGQQADHSASKRNKIIIRGTLALALVAGGVLTTEAVAGAAPGTPGVAENARAATERAVITHPDRDYMGWSARQAQADAATTYSTSVPTPVNPRTAGVTTAGVTGVAGVDVSHWQGNTDWAYWWRNGRRFAYVKATEGTTYRDPSFSYQYSGSYNVGMIRGSYHFATPNTSSGAAQANFFVAHGGGWSRDGRTLPGVLDIEYNPYGATCYGLSKTAMVNWVRDFARTYKAKTGRDAVIYTSLSWWSSCTGNSAAFNQTNPLWIPRYSTSPGTLPGGWGFHTFWQHTDSPLDQDVFNGALSRLQALARG